MGSRPYPFPRPGFNRVELAIVLGIGVVLAGLFVTMLPRLWERSHRLQCQNNLRQMGEGIYTFRDFSDPHFLPAARIADGYATWAVQIEPYLPRGKTEPMQGWELLKPYVDQDEEVRRTQKLIYYCPSRRFPPQYSNSGDTAVGEGLDGKNYPGALSDYACSAGTGDPRFSWTGPTANGAIILAEVTKEKDRIVAWRGRTDFAFEGRARVALGPGDPEKLKTRLKGLPRGTSRTILIGEKHVPLGEFGRADQGDGSVYNGGRPANFSRIGGPRYGLAGSPNDGLDIRFPIFGSYHPGICQFLMADGSVSELANGINEEVLGDLVVRE